MMLPGALGLAWLTRWRLGPGLEELGRLPGCGGGLWLPPGWRALSLRRRGAWLFRHGAVGGGCIVDDLDARVVVLTAWDLWSQAGGQGLPLPPGCTASRVGASWRLEAPGGAVSPGPLPEQLREVWGRYRRAQLELVVGFVATTLVILAWLLAHMEVL